MRLRGTGQIFATCLHWAIGKQRLPRATLAGQLKANFFHDAFAVGNTEALKYFAVDDYIGACRSCEIQVTMATMAMLRAIKQSLFCDRRPKGAHGRTLRLAIPGTSLDAGDRLELTLTMPDVAMIDDFDVSSFPSVTLSFQHPIGACCSPRAILHLHWS